MIPSLFLKPTRSTPASHPVSLPLFVRLFLYKVSTDSLEVKMRFTRALPLFACHTLLVHSNAFARDLEQPVSGPFAVERRADVIDTGLVPSHRRMVAARSTLDLEARHGGIDSFFKHDHVLHFIEGTSQNLPTDSSSRDRSDDLTQIRGPIRGSQSPFAAHVRLSSTLPTLLLEDNDSHLEHIACHESTIEIEFYDHAAASAAWGEVQTRPEMIAITSHPGCNADGERKPYLFVSRISLHLTGN